MTTDTFEFDDGTADLIARHRDVSIGHITKFLNTPVKPGIGYVIHGEGDEVSKKLIFSTSDFNGVDERDLIAILVHRNKIITSRPQDPEILKRLNEIQDLLNERAEQIEADEAILNGQHDEWTALPNGIIV